MKQFTHRMHVATRGKGLYPITTEIEDWTKKQGLSTGLLTVFIQHTSASLTIQEKADADVVRDLDEFFERLAPPDDMPAHIRAALTPTQISIPLMNGALALGTWQGIYLFEHRVNPHRRSVVLHLAGE
ncbi:MAG: hypothetical protein DMG58_26285 [Acidobacteria bacterium]|nr:MAG: hypothetical protein DMG58_26285 [Acidobacteriota bacterium]